MARAHTKGLPSSKEMLFMWKKWTFCKRLLVGKWQRGASEGAETPRKPISPMNVVSVVVAALKSNAAITHGMVGKMEVDIMLDSGSSVSLIQEGVATDFLGEKTPSPVGLTLVSAAGEDIPVLGCITVPLGIGSLQVSHSLIIVQSLIAPVILGLDFLQKHRLVLDFASSPVKISLCTDHSTSMKDVKPMLDTARQVKNKICAVEALTETTEESIDDCAVPLFGKKSLEFDIPVCTNPAFLPLLDKNKGYLEPPRAAQLWLNTLFPPQVLQLRCLREGSLQIIE